MMEINQKVAEQFAPVQRRRVGRPSQSDARDIERAVTEAALAEFRVHGLSGSSIERIARAAGVTRTAIYRRHLSRETLFMRVIDMQIAALERQASDLIGSAENPLDALKQTARAYCHFVLSPVALDLQRIVVREAASMRNVALMRATALPVDLTDPLDSLIRAGQDAGLLRAAEPALLRDVLVRLVADGPRWQALAGDAQWDDRRKEEDFERMWRVFAAFAVLTDHT